MQICRSRCREPPSPLLLFKQAGQHKPTTERRQVLAQDGDTDEATALVTLLRSCTKCKDLLNGIKIHDDILQRGLLEQCLDALIIMYAKCGQLGKANELFDMHTTRDLSTWTTLISEHAQHGQGRDALALYQKMIQQGIAPDAVTFTCVLKACSSIGAYDEGEKFHHEIAKLGLLRDHIMLGNALVDMYAKCGALVKAREVLEGLPVRTVISWTALIAGYAQKGEGTQALSCFEQMQREGISPNVVTFICILKACGSIKAADKGERIHDEIVKRGFLGDNVLLGTALVDMYAKCGALAKAKRVLEQLPVRNVISWNALIAGYIHEGQADQALNCFESMQREGLSPDAVTFTCILNACGSIKAVDKGGKIHKDIVNKGLLRNNVTLANALLDMYVKCQDLSKAQQVLEEINIKDVISWSTLIAGYAQECKGEQALKCFEQMQCEGLSPDAVTYVCILKACASIGAIEKGERIHDEIAKKGLLEDNVALGTALVDMYGKCGALAKARRVLEELPIRSVVSWSALISGYAEDGEGEQALNCFEQMQREGLSPDGITFNCILTACGNIGAADKGGRIHYEIMKQGLLEKDLVLGNGLIDMYVKCGDLSKARQVLEDLPVRDALSWNTLIAGYTQQDEIEEALSCFEGMQRDGIPPDPVTFSCLLKACGSIAASDQGEKIHDEISKQGILGKNIVLGNALVDMYAKCGALSKAREVLEELPARDAISWNTLIAGYAEQGQGELALLCYDGMQQEGIPPNSLTFTCVLKACGIIGAADKGEKIHDDIAQEESLKSDIVLGTALVDMYAKCGALAKARQALQELPVRNVTSWNAMISGYARHCQGGEALKCLEQMQLEGITPDAVTFICILKACGNIGATDKGEDIHEKIAKQGLLRNDVVLGTAVVDMYAKCNALVKAQQMLEELPLRNVTSWNALITGYTQQCKSRQALNCFDKMQGDGLCPDGATFSCVLNACSRLGFEEDARMYLVNMCTKYGVEPNVEHYTCMLDLFGRAGHLDKAVGVIEMMPSFTYGVWCALLSACRKWGDVSVGRWAFDHAIKIDKHESSVYVLMADIYVAAGMHADAEYIEASRRENKAW